MDYRRGMGVFTGNQMALLVVAGGSVSLGWQSNTWGWMVYALGEDLVVMEVVQ